ncbi:hypothetical protein EMPS_10649 [Entomortierella parvispora]|uniref:Mediator of RNA polymerase II transcription subunit 18 n=1 Tax=Entomortierella parvispora TaxID=205924 RepID=A0A9P3HKK3_9FUNG|nr:hypothetical protein EMPS_10649 [Entomortierella parvispora]
MSGPGSLSGGASFECSLAGVVLPGQFGQLYDRLLGLCEHSAHAKMLEHELLFSPSVQRPMYAARNDEVPLRLRVKLTVLDQDNKKKRSEEQDGTRKLQKSESTGSVAAAAAGTTAESAMDVDSTQETVERVSNGPSSASHTQHPYQGSRTIVTRQYQLCQYGHPEPGRNLVVRSAILVKIHGDAYGFLSLLGYGFEDEFVRRGFNFMYNNICRISVFRKYKLAKQHDPFSAIVPEGEAAGGSAADVASPWLVEITSSFVSQENVNSMSDEINVVRNLLAGSISY